MEVLDELEEFSEREKDFENKYIKTITELKSESAKTEAELSKACKFHEWTKNIQLILSFPKHSDQCDFQNIFKLS